MPGVCSLQYNPSLRVKKDSGNTPSGKPNRSSKKAAAVSSTIPPPFPYAVLSRYKINPNPPPTGVKFGLSCFGGGGGSRTPVRKRFLGNFSGRRGSFTFPRSGVGPHTQELGSQDGSWCAHWRCARTFAAKRRPIPGRGPPGWNGHGLSRDELNVIVGV